MRRSVVMLCCALVAGCGGEMATTDAQVADGHLEDAAGPSPDGSERPDAAVDDRGVVDDRAVLRDAADVGGSPVDAPAATDVGMATDAVVTEAGALDAGARDVVVPDTGVLDTGARDVPATDTGAADVRLVDASVLDAPAIDAGAADVPRDVPDAGDVRPAVDAPTGTDVPRVDAGCAVAAPTITVSAPTSAEAIETCTTAGLPVYYEFIAAVTAPARVVSVTARWITPDGLEAPPPASLSAGPFVFRRQVGGPSAGTPALSVFGIRGNWRVDFTATDACGRSTTASQTFSLIFTTRRCPNP